jgi:tetratricopeptide (TPR) repeat protein
VAYANSFEAGFVLDARALILENPELRRASLGNAWRLVTRDYWQPLGTDGLYRPLATLSYLFNYAVLGNAARPFGYHAVNLLLHLAGTGLVYALVAALGGRVAAALTAAAVFGLHPVATEVVTNLAGRPDLLATLGVLAGLLSYVRLTQSEGRVRHRWTAGFLVAALVAFFSKESGLALVPIVVLYDVLLRVRAPTRAILTRPWRLVQAEHLVLVAAAAGYFAARWAVAWAGLPPDDTSPVDNPIVEAGFLAGRLTGITVMVRELALVVWPHTLSADYSFAQIPVVAFPPRGWADWGALVALAALVATVLAALCLRRRSPALAFFILFAVVALVPTANLVVVIGSIMAERFLYLPLAGFAGAVGLLAARLGERRQVALGVGAVLVLSLLAWRTAVRNRDWRNELTLWESAVHASPASAKAHKAYAAALFAADGQRNLQRAIEEAEQAVAIRPDYLPALIDLGGYYVARGDAAATEEGDGTTWYERAVAVLDRARALDRSANRRFGEKMLAKRRDGQGIPRLGNIELYQNVALAFGRLGRFADALEGYEEARALAPSDPSRYVDISAVLCQLGRWEEAAVALFQAVAIQPEARDAPTRLVEVYRTFDPDGRQTARDAQGRVTVNLDDPGVRRHRCAAYEGLGRIFADANQPGAEAQAKEWYARHCARRQ